jgi:hypothetical protein
MIDVEGLLGPPADGAGVAVARQDRPKLLQRQPVAAGALPVATVRVGRPPATPGQVDDLLPALATIAAALARQVLVERVLLVGFFLAFPARVRRPARALIVAGRSHGGLGRKAMPRGARKARHGDTGE